MALPLRRQRLIALVILVVIWTASFAGLVIWDQRELTQIARKAGVELGIREHLTSELVFKALLWAAGAAGIAATFYWFRLLDAARERAFAAMRESESDLSSVIEAIDDVVFGLDAAGHFQVIARARDLERLVSEPLRAEGRAIAEVLPAGAAEALLGAVAALEAGGATQSVDFITERGGTEVHWNARLSRRRSARAGVPGVLVVARDITHRSRAEAALKDREELWRLVYERSGEGIILTEPNGTCVSANQAACEILGLSEAELIGQGRGMLSESERSALAAMLDRRDRTGQARGELSFTRRDGRRVELEGAASLFRLSDGATRSVIIIRDITARKAAEAAAAENALRWQGALDAAGDGLWDWDFGTGHAFFSPTAVRLFGFAVGEISPHINEWQSRVHPDDLPAVLAAIEGLVAGYSQLYESEHRVMCKDGTYKWVRSRGRVLMRDGTGRPRRLIGTVQDLTAARLAQRQLRESEERYRVLFSHAADPVVVFPIESEGHPGRFMEVNDAACRLVGFTREEMVTKSVLDFETPESLAEMAPRIAALHETGHVLFEAEVFAKSGQRIAVETHATLFQREGRFWVFSSMRDLSERRQAEAEIARLARERAVMLETLPIGVCLLRERRVQWANRTIEVGLGYAPGELTGLATSVLYASPEVSRRVGVEGYTVIAAGGTYETEVEFARRDGKTVWGHMTGRALNPANLAEGTLWAIVETTERRVAEQALRESQEKFSRTFQAAPVMIVVTDQATGQILEANAKAVETTGYQPAEAMGRTVVELGWMTSEIREAIVSRLTRDGFVRDFEVVGRNSDGRPMHCLLSCQIVEIGGRPRVVSILQDITARKLAEAALVQTQRELRLFFDQSLTGFFFATFAEPIRWDASVDKTAVLESVLRRPLRVQANAALAAQYGAPVDAFSQFVPGTVMSGGVAAIGDLWRRLFDAGRLHAETAERRMDGTPIVIEGDYTCIHDAEGRITAYFGAQRDVTDRKARQQELMEAEARLRSVSDNLPGCMMYQLDTGVDGEQRRFVHFSAGIERMHGVTAEAAMRDPGILYAQMLPEDRRLLVAQEASVVRERKPFRMEARYRAPSGEIRWLLISSAPRVAANGHTLWDGVELDITGAKQTQEALVESEARYRLIAENVSDVIWVIDLPSERFTYVSPSCVRLHGYTPDELCAMPAPESLTMESRRLTGERLMTRLSAIMADPAAPRTFVDQMELLRKDGTAVWVESTTTFLVTPDGRASVVGVSRDLTERLKANAALAESRSTYLGVLNTVTEAIYVHDENGVFLDVNEGAARMYGWTREELIGKTPLDVAAPDRNDLPAVGAQSARVFASGRSEAFEFWGRRKNGEEFPKACVTSRGKYFGRDVLITTARDITVQKRAEDRERRDRELLRFLLSLYGEASNLTELAVFDRVVESAVALTGSRIGFLHQVHENQRDIILTTWNQEARRMCSAQAGTHYPIDQAGNWVDCVREQRPVVYNNFARSPNQRGLPDGHVAVERFLSVPVVTGGKVRIIFGVGNKATDYDEDDLARVQIVAAELQKILTRTQHETALRDSEQRFRTVFDSAPIGIVEEDFSAVKQRLDELRAGGVTDLRAYLREHTEEVRGLTARVQVLLMNRRSAEIMGGANAATGTHQIESNLADDAWSVMREEFCALASGQTSFAARVPAIDARGRRRLVDLTLAVQPGHEESLDRVIVAFADITEQQRTEEERRRLARAVEQSPVTIVITDRQGVIEYVNPQFTKIMGYKPDEVRGKTSRLLKSGVHSAGFYQEMWATILGGKEWRGELCNRRKDGRQVWEDTSISPVFDEGGQITHYLAVKEDVTERRAVHEQIRQQAALLDVTQDAVFVLGLDYAVSYLNRSAQKLYGVTAAQALGRRYEELVYGRIPADSAEKWKRLHDSGQAVFERRHKGPKGEEIFVQVRATLVRDAADRSTGVLLVVTDITESKRMESQFLRAQRLENLGALASGVAHDLNNVLTPILVATELLKPMARQPHEREVVHLVVESARRGADIVQQLLLFGRGSDTPRVALDSGVVAKGVMRMMRETFPKNLTLHSAIPDGLWPVEADRTQLHQVLLNLCVNARDAMPGGGDLTVSAVNTHVDAAYAAEHLDAKPGPYVALAVTDTGSGIPREIVEKIFDPFFTTKPVGKGTGLGLSTVLGITRSHGGFISLETEPGHGSKFTVFLPAKQTAEVRASGDEIPRRLTGNGELILVVDDEPAIRLVAERALEKANYRVVSAANGAEALVVFTREAGKVRLVFSDMMMPVMDGPQLVHALRQLNPDIPIVATSGLRDAREELQQRHGRRLRFLQKPFLVEAALQAIRELLDEAAQPK